MTNVELTTDLESAVDQWRDTPCCWGLLNMAFLMCKYFMIYGPAGTGKTHFVFQMCELFDQVCMRAAFHDTSSADEARGTWVQQVDPETGSSQMVFNDGPLVVAMLEGATLIADEVNRWSEECLTLLYYAMDGKGFVLPDGREILPADGFRVIGTSNDDPECFPEGLRSRFTGNILVDDLAPGLWEKFKNDAPALLPMIKETFMRGKEDAYNRKGAECITGREWSSIVAMAHTCGDIGAALAIVAGPEQGMRLEAQVKIHLAANDD